MTMPTWLTKKRLAIVGFIVLAIIAYIVLTRPAKAEEPCPPGCQPEQHKAAPPKPTPKPKPLPPTPPTVPKGPARAAKGVPRENEYRPLVGGGASLGHSGSEGWHLFGGLQFPDDKRGGNWQLQIGGAFEKHDAFDAECTIRCRTCGIHINDWTDERAVISGVYVF